MKSAAKYFAHTAALPDGKPDPDQGHWQLLSTHFSNVGERPQEFGMPLGLFPRCRYETELRTANAESGPVWKSEFDIRILPAPYATENLIIPAFLEMLINQPQNASIGRLN